MTGTIILAKDTVPVAVERTALHTFEDRTVVFLETIEGFVPQPVRISRMDAVRAEVLDGLSAGDRYVSAGGFTLKAELGKESFGDGHGH